MAQLFDRRAHVLLNLAVGHGMSRGLRDLSLGDELSVHLFGGLEGLPHVVAELLVLERALDVGAHGGRCVRKLLSLLIHFLSPASLATWLHRCLSPSSTVQDRLSEVVIQTFPCFPPFLRLVAKGLAEAASRSIRVTEPGPASLVGSSAGSSTSRTLSTRISFKAFRVSSGRSSRSGSFSRGTITRLSSARCAASSFSRRPKQ